MRVGNFSSVVAMIELSAEPSLGLSSGSVNLTRPRDSSEIKVSTPSGR